MAKSIFQSFTQEIWKVFKVKYPFISKIPKDIKLDIPKSSSFYCGLIDATDKHLYINFQHSPKSWETGMFTVNVYIASQIDKIDFGGMLVESFLAGNDGQYRLGILKNENDKWWGLIKGNPKRQHNWLPDNYDSEEETILSAIKDVCTDLEEAVFRKIKNQA